MKNFVRLLARLYRWLLRLYPRRFREIFSEEMSAVFAARLADTEKGGAFILMKTGFQEICALGSCVLFENWLMCKEAVMKRLQFSNRSIRTGGWGAVGFGVAFAVIKVAPFMGVRGGMWLYMLGGLLGGTLFSFASDSRKQMGGFALFGAGVFGIGHLVVALLMASFVRNISTASLFVILIPILEPVVIGALVGIGMGALERDWRLAVRLTLASAVGFGLGQVAGFVISLPVWGITQAIDSYRPGWDGQLSPWVSTMGSLMVRVIASIISGIVGGATLGRTIKRLQST